MPVRSYNGQLVLKYLAMESCGAQFLVRKPFPARLKSISLKVRFPTLLN
jgi:hypothetical protein